MFIYSMLKAVRLGYVSDADGSIVSAAKKAYNYATANWVTPKSDGTFDWQNTVIVNVIILPKSNRVLIILGHRLEVWIRPGISM